MVVSRAAVSVLFLAACGGDDPAEPPEGCDFLERDDAGNDVFAMTPGTAEATGVALEAEHVFCGRVDPGHFRPAAQGPGIVDVDTFTLDVAADTSAVISLTGTGLETLALAQMIIADEAGTALAFASYDPAIEHGIELVAALAPGSYRIALGALNPADPEGTLDYRAKIATYDLAGRCADPATPAFVEANDGAASTGNDMIEVRFTGNTANATAATTDNPEPSNVTVAPGTPALLQGSLAMVDPADEYLDRDTFAVTAGDASHLIVRLAWPATGADLDFFLFGENMPDILAPSGTITSTTRNELELIPITPGTKYWLWAGAYDASMGLPLAYNATLCAESFVP